MGFVLNLCCIHFTNLCCIHFTILLNSRRLYMYTTETSKDEVIGTGQKFFFPDKCLSEKRKTNLGKNTVGPCPLLCLGCSFCFQWVCVKKVPLDVYTCYVHVRYMTTGNALLLLLYSIQKLLYFSAKLVWQWSKWNSRAIFLSPSFLREITVHSLPIKSDITGNVHIVLCCLDKMQSFELGMLAVPSLSAGIFPVSFSAALNLC